MFKQRWINEGELASRRGDVQADRWLVAFETRRLDRRIRRDVARTRFRVSAKWKPRPIA